MSEPIDFAAIVNRLQEREAPEPVRVDNRARDWRRLIERYGSRYEACTLEGFRTANERQKKALGQVQAFVAAINENIAAGRSLLLAGPCGTGKEHLLIAVIREAIRNWHSVEWINAQDWFGSLRDRMDGGYSERAAIAELVKPDVLAVSDAAPPVGQLTDFQSGMLYRVVDGRYRAGKPTWMTANVATGKEAETRIGAAATDRMREGLIVQCVWESYRQERPA